MSDFMAQRVRSLPTSVFTEMSALAVQYDAINLSQGFPDFAGPAFIKDAAVAAIKAERNQYAPSHGIAPLRDAIARLWKEQTNQIIDVDHEITVTCGATEALIATTLGCINPGDEVVIFEPFYDAYPPDVFLAGGIPRYVRLPEPHWSLPLEQLKAVISPQTRAIMLNTPHNPCGKVWSLSELQAIAALAVEHNLLVISDEVYDRLVFDAARHVSIASLPGMWERTITINSTGKTFSLTGWKIGYVIAAAHLTEAIRRVHQFVTFCAPTPLQWAMAHALNASQAYERQLLGFYTDRRKQLMNALQQAGMAVLRPAGTYFMLADISALGWSNDVEFCRFLTTEVGVAAIPPSAFYHDGYQSGLVRFCFAKRPETIAAAAQRLHQAQLSVK